jgi:hypothetical protein
VRAQYGLSDAEFAGRDEDARAEATLVAGGVPEHETVTRFVLDWLKPTAPVCWKFQVTASAGFVASSHHAATVNEAVVGPVPSVEHSTLNKSSRLWAPPRCCAQLQLQIPRSAEPAVPAALRRTDAGGPPTVFVHVTPFVVSEHFAVNDEEAACGKPNIQRAKLSGFARLQPIADVIPTRVAVAVQSIMKISAAWFPARIVQLHDHTSKSRCPWFRLAIAGSLKLPSDSTTWSFQS